MGHFWGFQADEASLEKQRTLTAAINAQELSPLSVSLYPNLLCLAPFSDTHTEPGKYYRAKILHIMGSNVEVTHKHVHTHAHMYQGIEFATWDTFATNESKLTSLPLKY